MTLETGQASLKTDSGSRVIVWRLSHPSAQRRAAVPHTRGAWQLVAGNVHVSRTARRICGKSQGGTAWKWAAAADAFNRLSHTEEWLISWLLQLAIGIPFLSPHWGQLHSYSSIILVIIIHFIGRVLFKSSTLYMNMWGKKTKKKTQQIKNDC